MLHLSGDRFALRFGDGVLRSREKLLRDRLELRGAVLGLAFCVMARGGECVRPDPGFALLTDGAPERLGNVELDHIEHGVGIAGENAGS